MKLRNNTLTKLLSKEYPKVLYSYKDFKFYLVLCEEKQCINNEVSYDIRMSLVKVPEYVKRDTASKLIIYFEGPFFYETLYCSSFKNKRFQKQNSLFSIIFKRMPVYIYAETEQEFLNRTIKECEISIDIYIKEVIEHKEAFENLFN